MNGCESALFWELMTWKEFYMFTKDATFFQAFLIAGPLIIQIWNSQRSDFCICMLFLIFLKKQLDVLSLSPSPLSLFLSLSNYFSCLSFFKLFNRDTLEIWIHIIHDYVSFLTFIRMIGTITVLHSLTHLN